MKVLNHNILLAFCALVLFTTAAAETRELVLSAPPREDRAVAEKTYGPLAKFLTEQLGQPVVYRMPESWAAYSSALRKGDYDFVFDGPHFAAWRVSHLQHRPLVKLPGTMSFVVATGSENGIYNKLTDLRSGKICGMASPNLATNAVLVEFGPVATPNIIVMEGGYDGIVKGFESQKCDAMILRDSYYKKLPEEKRNKLKVLFTSDSYANQIITASPRVNNGQFDKLLSALLTEQGAAASKELISRFGDKDSKAMVAATAKEIEGNQRLLEGIVWGW